MTTPTSNGLPVAKASGSRGGRFSTVHMLLIVCGALLCQSMILIHGPMMIDHKTELSSASALSSSLSTSAILPITDQSQSTTQHHQQQQYQMEWLRATNPLAVPPGQAVNLPSVRHYDTQLNEKRKIYGGKGDAKHLGGFTEIDMMGLSPTVWKWMVQNATVQSVLDVGCGRGISTSWFYTHGLRTQCAEGSHDAVTKTMVPDPSLVVEHDFSRGPWWPGQTFDVAWAVEFLEHVNIQYHYNYISAFRKAAIIMVSSSRWGGWHHVEVHPDEWWIQKYEMYGFRYDDKLTKFVRRIARDEATRNPKIFPPTGKRYGAQHVFTSMKVFINPVVASLPEHAHLFATHGCYKGKGPNGILDIVNRECGTGKDGPMETKLDQAFLPLPLTNEQDEAWYKLVQDNIDPSKI